jgi:hypothetical protein
MLNFVPNIVVNEYVKVSSRTDCKKWMYSLMDKCLFISCNEHIFETTLLTETGVSSFIVYVYFINNLVHYRIIWWVNL